MFLTFLLARWRAWLQVRASHDELIRLTDRELADIGVSRTEVGHSPREFVGV